MKCGARSTERLLRLRDLVNAIDKRFPGGGNCYRRALLELSLDPTLASQPLVFGLNQGAGPGTGHAWLGDAGDGRTYAAEFRL
jgi:hypothetical protein